MKKFILLSVGLMLVACNSNEFESAYNSQVEEPSSTEIVNQCKAFNETLSISPKTRGGGIIWAVISTDALSTIPAFRTCVGVAAFITSATGGTAGPATGVAVLAGTAFLAGGASYGVYRGCGGYSIVASQNDFINETYLNPRITRNIDQFCLKIDSMVDVNEEEEICILNDSIYSLIGLLHNDILSSTIQEEEECASIQTNNQEIEDYEPIYPIIKQTEEVNSYGLLYYDDKDIEDMTSTIYNDMTDFFLENDYSKSLNQFKNKSYISDNIRQILNLFFNASSNSVSSQNDLEYIANFYKNTVRNSTEISNDEKQIILTCIEVAVCSYSFWKNRL